MMDLCFSCQQFSIHALCRSPGGWGTFRLKLAQDGARSGCSFCSMLVEAVLDKVPDEARSELEKENMRIHIQATKPRRLDAQSSASQQAKSSPKALQIDGLKAFAASATYQIDGEQPIEGSFATFHVCADRASYAAKSQAIAGRYMGADATSPAFLDGIRDWLAKCTRHSRCCRTLSGAQKLDAYNAPLPTRCIDVSGQQLLLTETAGMFGSYMTLSHRWSTDTELSQTTKINVHDRMGGGLDAAELPKSFRDAIWLAKQLEVRYMWIDSICIIQGADSTDWASEAENMAKYYQNSLLTIAATGVEGTNNPGFKFTNGLFPDSPPTFGRRLARLPFRDRDKASTQRGFFYVYPAKHINPEYNSEVLQGLLLRRGWVFQEWLLSRRLISFTPSGVYFDCQTELPTSALGDRLMVSKEDDQYERGFTLKPFIHFGIGGRVEDTWLEIAESYSGLELTFPTKDRLLALSGIATEYIEAVRKAQDNEALPAPNPNLSGLWFQDIHRGLLWQQMDASGIPRQRMDSWMPTWSWTSYMGPISWALFKKPQSISNACRIVGMITSSGAAYPAPHSTQSPTLAAYTPTWKHLLPLPWATKTDQAKYDAIPHLYEAFETHYPLNTEFTHLLVSCQLCTIKVWDCYTKSQLEALSVPTPSTSTTNDADSTGIRKISLVSSSRGRANIRDMCGWASFEDSAFQDQRDFWDGKPIYALHVLTSKASNGWMEQGLLRGWERIYMVIFIRRVDDDGDVYRRIGVGALWGDPVKRGFANAEMQTLQLV